MRSNKMGLLSLRTGILIATIRRPMRRTGRLASCQVTIPGRGGLINIYLVVVCGTHALSSISR